MDFEWDAKKDSVNQEKHGVSFGTAQNAFFDPKRVLTKDDAHSTHREERFFCFGVVEGKVMTVRFTYRNGKVRIFGAGYWREGRSKYESQNKIR